MGEGEEMLGEEEGNPEAGVQRLMMICKVYLF